MMLGVDLAVVILTRPSGGGRWSSTASSLGLPANTSVTAPVVGNPADVAGGCATVNIPSGSWF